MAGRKNPNRRNTKGLGPSTPDWFVFPTQSMTSGTGDTVTHPYTQVSALYAAVKAITRQMRSTEIWIMEDSNNSRAKNRSKSLDQLYGYESMRWKDAKQIDNMVHPLVALMNKPNPIMDSGMFREIVSLYYLVYGGCNIIKVGGAGGAFPVGLFPTPATGWERLYRHADQPFTFYGWRWGGSEFAAEDVISITNPDDTIYSNPLSGIQPLRDALQGDVSSKVWYKALLRNNARPGFAVVFNDTLTDEDLRKTRETLEDRYGGAENAGKPAVFQRGPKLETIAQLSPQQLQAVEARKIFIEDVCMVFGVPRTELGIVDNVPLATAKDLSRRFLENTVVPLMQCIQNALNDQLVRPTFGDSIWCEYQVKQLKGLREDFLSLSRTMKSFLENGVPYNEVVNQMELPFEKQAWGDVALISTNLQKVETLLNPPQPEAAPGPNPAKKPTTTVPDEPGAPEGPRNGPEAPKDKSIHEVLTKSRNIVSRFQKFDECLAEDAVSRFCRDFKRETMRTINWLADHGSRNGLADIPKSHHISAKSFKFMPSPADVPHFEIEGASKTIHSVRIAAKNVELEVARIVEQAHDPKSCVDGVTELVRGLDSAKLLASARKVFECQS